MRNAYYLAFEVITAGNRHVFDSFECAIHKLAPVCAHCGCKVIGQGIDANGTFYCCASCARQAGARDVSDLRHLATGPGDRGRVIGRLAESCLRHAAPGTRLMLHSTL